MKKDKDLLDKVADLVKRAKIAGADSADAIYVEGVSVSMACRKGELETLARSEGMDLGLRVFVGKRQAMVSSSDFSNSVLDSLVERAIAMARVVPEDEFCGIAPETLLAKEVQELENFDSSEPTEKDLEERALIAEEAALAVPGVSNSEGAEASWVKSFSALAASNGFALAMAVAL